MRTLACQLSLSWRACDLSPLTACKNDAIPDLRKVEDLGSPPKTTYEVRGGQEAIACPRSAQQEVSVNNETFW